MTQINCLVCGASSSPNGNQRTKFAFRRVDGYRTHARAHTRRRALIPQRTLLQVASRPDNYQISLHDLNDMEEASEYQSDLNPSPLIQRRRGSVSRSRSASAPAGPEPDSPPMARQSLASPDSLQDIPVSLSRYFSCDQM